MSNTVLVCCLSQGAVHWHSASCPAEAPPVKSSSRILSIALFLLTCGGTFHTEPRDWPSQRCSECTTYSTRGHRALLPLKIIGVNWKGSDSNWTEESEAETEREEERSLWTKLSQPVICTGPNCPSQPQTYSIYQQRTVKCRFLIIVIIRLIIVRTLSWIS